MSTFRIDEERMTSVSAAYREIDRSMLAGIIRLDTQLAAQKLERRLYEIPDPWCRVWALHLAQSTFMSPSEAISYVRSKYWQNQPPPLIEKE